MFTREIYHEMSMRFDALVYVLRRGQSRRNESSSDYESYAHQHRNSLLLHLGDLTLQRIPSRLSGLITKPEKLLSENVYNLQATIASKANQATPKRPSQALELLKNRSPKPISCDYRQHIETATRVAIKPKESAWLTAHLQHRVRSFRYRVQRLSVEPTRYKKVQPCNYQRKCGTAHKKQQLAGGSDILLASGDGRSSPRNICGPRLLDVGMAGLGHLLHGLVLCAFAMLLVERLRGGGPDERENNGQEDETVGCAEEANAKELLEEDGEDVAVGASEYQDSKEGGEGAVDDGGAHLDERVVHPLQVRALRHQKGVGDVRRVVDGEADGEDQVDDGDRVDGEVPQPHKAEDVDVDHEHAEQHEQRCAQVTHH
eukprot:5710823-Pleurochrysis_carterae.AAC.3